MFSHRSRSRNVTFRKIAVCVLFLVFVGAWVGYRAHSRHTQDDRERRYRVILEKYQRDLRVGMNRADVERYLEAHNSRYTFALLKGSGSAWSDKILIATEPSRTFVCGQWEIYVALDFDAPMRDVGNIKVDPTGNPQDVLKDIRVDKFCW
jgi:hypothetical protein